jgi:hypothetical protein
MRLTLWWVIEGLVTVEHTGNLCDEIADAGSVQRFYPGRRNGQIRGPGVPGDRN